jgi:hypothetical protein
MFLSWLLYLFVYTNALDLQYTFFTLSNLPMCANTILTK